MLRWLDEIEQSRMSTETQRATSHKSCTSIEHPHQLTSMNAKIVLALVLMCCLTGTEAIIDTIGCYVEAALCNALRLSPGDCDDDMDSCDMRRAIDALVS